MQVLFVSDPELLPTLFDRSLYPPNAHVLDRPVDTFLKEIDAVWNSEPGFSPLEMQCHHTAYSWNCSSSFMSVFWMPPWPKLHACKHVTMSIHRMQVALRLCEIEQACHFADD